ncbi:hypothetical protein Q1695_001182 [Nippostrongylus brasiliensis]|nr:hypothetical protein Q1695_001182 [Nippostrongylus brasiliensis]
MTFVAVVFFLACCSARPAVVCYKNGEKGVEVADLKELCEAEFTVPLCLTNKLLDATFSPPFADVMGSIKSIWRANAAALLASEKASKESNEKFHEEKLRYGELLLEKQGLEEENKRLNDFDRDKKNMERLISDHLFAVVSSNFQLCTPFIGFTPPGSSAL